MRRVSGIGGAAVFAACIFGAALLLSLVTGAGVYRQVENRAERSAVRRIGLSYLAAKIHAHDAAGAIRVGQFGDGGALFLTETDSEADADVYETVVYAYDGFLMELFRVRGAALEPEIRDSRIHQIDAAIQSGMSEGMMSMDDCILRMVRENRITRETALYYASNPEQLQRKLR